MKQTIKELCKKLEAEQNIKILFAIENGSRAWRMQSKDSDYDVRFVFVRNIEEYININPPVEVINVSYNKQGKKTEKQGALIDMSGFDIFKYAKLLSQSNPTTIEWIISDIVYYGKQNKTFREFAINNFDKKTLYLHYKSLCRNTFTKYIQSKNKATYKKYLYAFRGLVNAKWVAHKESIPPIIFPNTVKNMEGILPKTISSEIEKIIKIKSLGREKDKIENIKKLDNYIERFLQDKREIPQKSKTPDTKKLDDEIRKILLKN
jgi:hypothetical protein